FVLRLPSLAATGLERTGRTPDLPQLAAAEDYATGAYLADLLKGPGDKDAVGRMTDRLASLTGLDAEFLRRQAARPSVNGVQREIDRASGRVTSAYDTGITGWDPDPDSLHSGFEDPQLTALQAPLTSAMIDLYARTLKWPVPNQRYELLNNAVNRGWTWGSGRQAPEALSALKGALALDGKLRVLVAHGYTDLVTPYFASKLLIAQVPPYGGGRLGLTVYPGGHMFYSRADSRAAFHGDAQALFSAALKDRAPAR
ncbi:MAG: peptidase S10, partial [Parafilimonas terrae]|nr:peptidase S10 [Parafilimonas terrae]